MKFKGTNENSAELITELRQICERRIDFDLSPITDKLHQLYPETISQILLYGSCLRNQDFTEGVLDLYVIVTDYHTAYKNNFLSSINKLLPPNVFYLEASNGKETLRVKFAVLSDDDLAEGINSWFHPYIWARFAQPVRLIYSRSEDGEERLYQLLASSVIRYLVETLPYINDQYVDSEMIWTNALQLSFSAELRPERQERCREIAQQLPDDLSIITRLAQPALSDILFVSENQKYTLSIDQNLKNQCRRNWAIRRWQGKLLSILRLMKATFTFRDCADYAAWKINRHSGIKIEVTPALRKYPVLLGFKVLWQLIRRDAIR